MKPSLCFDHVAHRVRLVHLLRVTAEVKHNPTNTIVCKAHGEWNGTLEFTYNNGETKVIDTTALPVCPKKIRPLEKQGPMESRWGSGHFCPAQSSSVLDPGVREEASLRRVSSWKRAGNRALTC